MAVGFSPKQIRTKGSNVLSWEIIVTHPKQFLDLFWRWNFLRALCILWVLFEGGILIGWFRLRWISKHTHGFLWYIITNPFPNIGSSLIKSPQYTGGDFMFLYRFVRRRRSRRRRRRRPQILVHAITFEQLFGFLSFLAQLLALTCRLPD